VNTVRSADPDVLTLSDEELVESRLVGLKQTSGSHIEPCAIEHLLLLKGGHGIPKDAQRFTVKGNEMVEQISAYLLERVAREQAGRHRERLESDLDNKEEFIKKGFAYREAELAAARAYHTPKARKGNRKALDALTEVKKQQRQLREQKEEALTVMRREPELIGPGKIVFIAHALVVPTSSEADKEQHDQNVEQLAMDLARAHEESIGATVKDVHTPALARANGLPDNPGFDLLSYRQDGDIIGIEVKGRAALGDVEITANEWAKACNLRNSYWLYSVFNCATPAPELYRVQDPFGRLLAKAKGSMLINSKAIADAAAEE
jgi:hypothetical protein